MKEYQKRVIEEKAELDEKTKRLVEFLNSPMVDKVGANEELRLAEQLWHMKGYANVLRKRIAAFK